MSKTTELNCIYCSKRSDKDRLPRGWKRIDSGVVCDGCWKQRFVLRSITFPIVGPIDKEQWPQLREALAAAWGDSTRLANWLMTEHVKADRVRLPSDAKLWKSPNPYLYPHARKVCPTMATQSVVALCNQVQRKYNSTRIEVVWRGAASLPTFRYPVPYPLPAVSWSARYENNVPVVSVPIAGKRFDLVLRGSSEFRPHLAAFAQLVKGDAVKCEMSIYRKTAHQGDHRNGDTPQSRIMAKLVMWLPVKEPQSAEKVLVLRRPVDSFWVAEIPRRDPWKLHCDHVKRWIITHAEKLQRLSDDTKYEKRWPQAQRRNINEYREDMCRKQNTRLETFSHIASKMLAEFALRQRVSKVIYEDIDGGYLPSFPWFGLKTKLEYKLRERGIALEIAGGSRE